MNAADRYLKFVLWNEEDAVYVGYCPDLFPWGGVCHGTTEANTYRQLAKLVREEVQELARTGKPLPKAITRPMREAVLA